MNPEIKQQWISALRSGAFEQGRLNLKYDDGQGIKYCCLGVLCELSKADADLGTQEILQGRYSSGFFTDSPVTDLGTAYPPQKISDWAGLHTADAQLPRPFWTTSPRTGQEVEVESLAAANDYGLSFEDIARIIEEQF